MLSRSRTATRVVCSMSSKSIRSAANGDSTKRVRLIDPKSQAPYGGSAIAPHGFVAVSRSRYQRLLR